MLELESYLSLICFVMLDLDSNSLAMQVNQI